MATYFTDFTEYAVGTITGWTERFDTVGSWQIVANTGQGGAKNGLQYAPGTAAKHGLSWDVIDADPARADVDIWWRFSSSVGGAGTANDNRVFARGTGADATVANAVAVGPVNTVLRTSQVVAGASTDTNASGGAVVANTWYEARAHISGTTVQQRFWAAGTAEPTTWNQTITNTTVTGAGWVGVYLSVLAATRMTYDAIGVGTGTDLAPTAKANTAPSVSVGSGLTVAAGTAVSMTATATDAEGGTLTYNWTQLAGPTVTLTGTTTATCTFTPATAAHYSFRCTVTDNGGLSASADKAVNATSTTSRPETLVSNTGAWTANGTTSFPGALNDESNTTWVQSPTNPASPATHRYQLSPLATGGTTISYTYDQTATTPQLTLTATLLQGPAMTTIASWVQSPSTVITTANQTLNATQQAALTDGNNLYLDLTAS